MSQDHETESVAVAHKLPCDDCGSRDNKVLYDDGHTYCFGCKARHRGEAAEGSVPQVHSRPAQESWYPTGAIVAAIPARGLDEATTRKWGYLQGNGAQYAIYRDETGPVGAKVRRAGKMFAAIGSMKSPPLYGQWLWQKGGKKLVITEGEIDAMSVSLAQAHKYPVVSVPLGATGAAKALRAHMDWVNSFEEIVLWFDNDEAGQAAVAECVKLFKIGKVKVVKSELKDANEYLRCVPNRVAEIINMIWRAEAWRPDGIVRVRHVMEEALRDVVVENEWFLPSLTELTFGRRYGECYAFGAGTGTGKTDFLVQQIEYDVNTLKQRVGLILLEQNPSETVTRIAGKTVQKLLHIPMDVGNYTKDEKRAALQALDDSDMVFLYDHFGVASWDIIEERIRFMHHVEGIRIFYLDHLTALATGSERSEKDELERIMGAIGGLVKELKIILHFVSHLTTPDGTPHEEGGRVQIKQFKGSRSIGFWSVFMFGLERDQQAEDETERLVTTFRILKDRYTGRSNGKTLKLMYDLDTGILAPTTYEAPVDTSTAF